MQHILIVEDDRTIAESIAFILEQDSFSCQWFDNGTDALDYVENNAVDLMLLDVGLPDMSGFDVLRKFALNQIYLLSSLLPGMMSLTKLLALEGLGANGYITKPFSPRLVVAHVRSQLRRDRTDTNPESKFSINQDMQKILFHNQELTLTQTEFKILSHLIQHPNRVHTREYLMNIIWDKPKGSDKKTINTHIKSIRKRLKEIDESCDPQKLILTNRGIGYSLIE